MSAPQGRSLARRNLLALVAVLALVAALVLLPSMCRRYQRPSAFYPSVEEARRAGAGPDLLPPLVPPSAREIHVQRDRRSGRTFVRFGYAAEDAEPMRGGLRRLAPDEVERLRIPEAGWSTWWRLTPRTLRGSQGERVEVYHVPPERGGGYLVLDPRTRTAYHWNR